MTTESEPSSELEDLDSTSSESICESLRTQMQALAETSRDVEGQMRTILRKVKHADLWDAEQLPLTPKAPMARWLKAHGWKEPTIPFSEFLQRFFDAAKALDIENQSLHLEKVEADLFQVGTEVTIYALLRNLPLVFA